MNDQRISIIIILDNVGRNKIGGMDQRGAMKQRQLIALIKGQKGVFDGQKHLNQVAGRGAVDGEVNAEGNGARLVRTDRQAVQRRVGEEEKHLLEGGLGCYAPFKDVGGQLKVRLAHVVDRLVHGGCGVVGGAEAG